MELTYQRSKTEFESMTDKYTAQSTENFKIFKRQVSLEEAKAMKLRSVFNGDYEYYNLLPGEYVVLATRFGEVIMSNTAMEWDTNKYFVTMAEGTIFIGGLGLGLIVQLLEKKKDVGRIVVVEREQEIIDMVTSQIKFSDKVKIICDDVFTFDFSKYSIPVKYDYIYFDIWNSISGSNYPYMKALTKKYKKNKREPLGEILHWRKSDCRDRYKN